MAENNNNNNTKEAAKIELRQFLETTKASNVETPHNKVVEVLVTMTPVEAAKELWNHKVIGAPVWDDDNQKYVGFFDMRDLLSTVIASHKEEQELALKKGKDYTITKWFQKSPSGPHADTTKSNSGVFTVSYLAARNPFVSLTEDATLMDVCKVCADRHCHRVPIIDHNTGRCIRILSQSILVKFLVEHLLAENKNLAIKKLFDQTLKEAGLPYQKNVMTAPDTATASQVFELMDRHRLSGIAIVDAEDGALIGNTSATDIKLAVAVDDGGEVADLGLNVVSYLSAVRQEDNTKETRYPSTHIKESSTLGHAVKLLAKTGYHRVFVVDAELKPIGVVSVTDVVAFLAHQQ